MMTFHWGDCKPKIEKLEFEIGELSYKLKLRTAELESISRINEQFKREHEKLRKQLCNLELWAQECERKALKVIESQDVVKSEQIEVIMNEADVQESREQPVRKKKK